jgi:hypothetical protein
MRELLVELYSEPTNNAVMRIPGRKFPGVLVQGDSLRTLYLAADAVWRRAVKQGDNALTDEALTLRESLLEMIGGYEMVLAENQLPLPYPK